MQAEKWREALRFLLAGALNTATTYGLYIALLGVLDYRLAYATAYLVGIGLAYVLNAWFVFRRELSWRTALRYPLIYVVQFLFGVGVLHVLVDGVGVNRRWAILVVIALSIPLSFLLNRLALLTR